MAELRKKHLEERNKKIGSPHQSSNGQEEQPSTNPTLYSNVEQEFSPQKVTALSLKEQNILNLIQLIIRHGEKIIHQDENITIYVGEYIIQELRKDNITLDNPLYQLILDEYMAHYQEPNWVSANYFQHHTKGEVSQFAVDMLADKYQLSRMYGKQVVSENVVKEVELPTEANILPELTQRMLLELKYTIVNERIDSMQAMLKEAQLRDDWVLIRTILAEQPALMDIRQQLCKALGNRVIVG